MVCTELHSRSRPARCWLTQLTGVWGVSRRRWAGGWIRLATHPAGPLEASKQALEPVHIAISDARVGFSHSPAEETKDQLAQGQSSHSSPGQAPPPVGEAVQ